MHDRPEALYAFVAQCHNAYIWFNRLHNLHLMCNDFIPVTVPKIAGCCSSLLYCLYYFFSNVTISPKIQTCGLTQHKKTYHMLNHLLTTAFNGQNYNLALFELPSPKSEQRIVRVFGRTE